MTISDVNTAFTVTRKERKNIKDVIKLFNDKLGQS